MSDRAAVRWHDPSLKGRASTTAILDVC